MYQIVTRFVLEQPAEWSEMLIRFTLIWMVFLGIPTAFRQGAMVSVDVLYRMGRADAAGACSTGSVAVAALVLIARDALVRLGLRVARRASRPSAGSSRSR